MIAKQAARDVDRLENAKTFVTFLEKAEVEETSRRGLLFAVRRRGEHPYRAGTRVRRSGPDRAPGRLGQGDGVPLKVCHALVESLHDLDPRVAR